MGQRGRIRAGHAVRHCHKLALLQSFAHTIGLRQAHHGIGGHDPDRLDASGVYRLKQVDGLESPSSGDPRTSPEPLHARAIRGTLQLHVCREQVGHAADFSAAHRIGLSCQGQRPHARAADALGVDIIQNCEVIGFLREGDRVVGVETTRGQMRAPKVVAKGADEVAAKIREIAAENKVALLEAPPLARALYRHAELGDEIPAALYTAVAEVLAYVFQLRAYGRNGGVRPQQPDDIAVPAEMDPLNPAAQKTDGRMQ